MEEKDIFEDGETIGDIFTDKEAVVDGIRKSAEAVGLDPDRVAPEEEKRPEYYAKKNCKKCWGQGVLFFVPSPVKAKKVRIDGESITLPANALADHWDTGRPEHMDLKKNIGHYVHCSCVRILEEEDDE